MSVERSSFSLEEQGRQTQAAGSSPSDLAAQLSAGINASYLMEPPTRRASVPPLPPEWALSLAWLYSALLGNGHLLVCLDESATPVQCFYPHIDGGPHVRSLLQGVQVEREGQAPQVSWFAEEGWSHELRYLPASAVVSVRSMQPHLGLALERRLAVHPERDLLVIELRLVNQGQETLRCGLVTYAAIDIDLRPAGNCAWYDPETELLTFFHADRYLALGSDWPVTGFACEQSRPGVVDVAFQMAAEQRYSRQEFAVGQVAAALQHHLGELPPGASRSGALLLSFGRTLEAVRTTLIQQRGHSSQLLEETLTYWQQRCARFTLSSVNDEISRLYERSLMVLHLLSDRDTGAILAAPEMDPTFRSSGGYGMCWLRDGAYNAHALDVAGEHERARAFFDWALRTQEASGCWYQRYDTQGNLAPTWGLIQFDEIGIFVWALGQHVDLTGDVEYARSVWPALKQAGSYMLRELDPETGLAPITKDLWEEFDGISTYACATTWAGFAALARLARLLGTEAEAQQWQEAAARLKQAIEQHLWSEAAGHFLRGGRLKVAPLEGHETTALTADEVAITIRGRRWRARRSDPTLDISILGLAVPCGVFGPTDPRLQATARAIAERLRSPVGGILRYQGDSYRGGNPWILCTLWLAWYEALTGNLAEAEQLYRWAVEHRTPLDLLAEQVSRQDGQPCWIMPLGWSHAMFVLVTQVLRARGRLQAPAPGEA
ncbi:glycoside hydrolase family 15 protein [Thermogemmatispora carboxidivorans]|uniref:glycoside hydrolase family 15 protein n=1 Tax=Thermogemmatispora carboxidivorans TaxID=1382306 RepID=UPI00069ABE7E|nr:glycoside hydrolase family 15 protein [Thermogemmatispora carboxidivorans]